MELNSTLRSKSQCVFVCPLCWAHNVSPDKGVEQGLNVPDSLRVPSRSALHPSPPRSGPWVPGLGRRHHPGSLVASGSRVGLPMGIHTSRKLGNGRHRGRRVSPVPSSQKSVYITAHGQILPQSFPPMTAVLPEFLTAPLPLSSPGY